MARSNSKEIIVNINPASGGGTTALQAAFLALGAGASANFTVPNWPGLTGYASWNERGFRDATNKRIRWLCKNVAGNAPALHQYDEVSGLVSDLFNGNPSGSLNSSLTGHPYTSHSMDTENGDYYFLPWDNEIRKWTGSPTAEWPIQTGAAGDMPWSGVSASNPRALAFSKNLFGTGNPGFVVARASIVYGYNIDTSTQSTIFSPPNLGNHISLHTLDNGDVIFTQGIGTSDGGSPDAYKHPQNTVRLHTWRIVGGATPVATRIQDAPNPDGNKIGSHTSTSGSVTTRANHLVSLGSRVFVLEVASPGSTSTHRVWELVQGSLAFPEWILRSWGHALQTGFELENFIVVPCEAYGGFLGIQCSPSPYSGLVQQKWTLWKPE